MAREKTRSSVVCMVSLLVAILYHPRISEEKNRLVSDILARFPAGHIDEDLFSMQ